MPRADDVRTMFDRIAGRYDLVNRLMTMGIDGRWRRAAVRAVDIDGSSRVLDACCGTGDLTFLLAEAGAEHVTGLDFSGNMLVQARRRQRDYRDPAAARRVEFVQGDALDLPLETDSLDAVTVAFGVRNVERVDGAFSEFARVLRPGGKVACLEITRPDARLPAAFHGVWFDRVVPVLGGTIGGDRPAYRYLPESTRDFPRPPQLAQIMRGAGFEQVGWRRFAGGIVALHVGTAP